MKNWKHIFAVTTALCICAASIPITETSFSESFLLTVSASEADTSGTCGENLTWTFDESTGTLTISGTGEMAYMSTPVTGKTESTSPRVPSFWSFGNEKINSVIIENGVTNIVYSAFNGCYNLTSITIPKSMLTIEMDAFTGCSALSSVTIPESVTNIELSAFDGCSSLNAIVLYNPDCDIYDDSTTFPENTAIFGYIGSTAQEYAEKYNREFVALDTEESDDSDTVVQERNISLKIGSGDENGFFTCNADVTECIISDTSVVRVTDTKSQTVYGVTVPATATIIGLKNGTTDVRFTLANGEIYLFHVTVGTGSATQETESETETETAETTPVSYSFLEGGDNWSFSNNRTNFGNKYYLKDKDYQKLLTGLSHTEKETIYKAIRERIWEGSCYGMAVTSILAANGIINPSDYEKNANFLHDIPSATDDVKSLINYYYMLQKTNVISALVRQAQYESESEKLQKLISCLEDNSPTLLSFTGKLYDSDKIFGGHAVVAYGIDYGRYSFDGKSYNGKILIYDNAKIDYDAAYCLYFNSHDWSWTIPYYQLGSATGAVLGMITDDVDVLNYHGCAGTNTNAVSPETYIAQLNANTLNTNYSLHKAVYADGNWMNAAVGEDDIRQFASLGENGENCDILFALKDTESGYVMQRTDKAGLLNLSMEYENSLLNISADSAKEAYFSPAGCISVDGQNTDYEMQIVLNEGSLVTDWYSFSVKGRNIDNAKLEKAENGYILTASNLKSIQSEAYNDDTFTDLNFSSDDTSVLLYEIDENTIGVKEDTDNDGIYDTLIAQTPAFMMGDTNRDGKISILDVIFLNRAVLGKDSLNIIQAQTADINQNNVRDSSDSLMILKYIVGLISSLTD